MSVSFCNLNGSADSYYAYVVLIIRILILRWEVLRQNKVVNHRKLSLIVRTAILTAYSLVVLG